MAKKWKQAQEDTDSVDQTESSTSATEMDVEGD